MKLCAAWSVSITIVYHETLSLNFTEMTFLFGGKSVNKRFVHALGVSVMHLKVYNEIMKIFIAQLFFTFIWH